MVLKTKPVDLKIKESSLLGQPLIQAENLGIRYEGEKEKRDDYKSLVHKLLYKQTRDIAPIWALCDLSFSAYAGDILGVIGHNGAGKTTLCRTIIGMLKPDAGKIHVRGKVSSLLSLGAGFNKNLSGKDNIMLNGMMLGMSRKDLKEAIPLISDFSGLGHFLNQPLRYYSNGMKARLGFSIASALEAEILVIDEVLGTGDLEFKKRAVKKMINLVKKAKMVLVVSHDPYFIEENCNRAIWLDHGRLKACGKPKEVVALYKNTIYGEVKPKKKKILDIQRTRTEIGKQKKTVQVKNLGIQYKLDRKPFWALKDVSFAARDKEILGIIGPNGAGKTTLCRVLSGLYKADSGNIMIKGNINALLSFGVGFNEQLSGKDNIYLNGMMLGIPMKRIREIENEIIDFSGLADFIYQPVKYYSRGMKSRLGFSIAAMLKPDIFIIDEALSAGDLSFQEKAAAKMQELIEGAKTVILVTHSLDIIEKVCTRAIWIQNGNIRYDGDPKDTVKNYTKSVQEYMELKRILPIKRDIRLKQAVDFFGTGQYKLAEIVLEEVLAESPHDFNILYLSAIIAEYGNNLLMAKDQINKAILSVKVSGKNVPRKAKIKLEDINYKLKLNN